MALNLAALVATLQSGKWLSPAEALAIQNISAEASKDLTLLQSLYNTYKVSPSADTLQKIQSMIPEIHALEACDAVESDKLGYEIDGVMVSDFITPAWFEPTRDEPSAAIPLGSRRQRRNLGRAEWRRSQHRF